MNIQFLGTAAAEGIPAAWCCCDVCQKSRKVGGRALRTRSQALIDGTIMIDWPADAYAHVLINNIDLLDIKWLLFTHTHMDHLYQDDLCLLKKGFAHTSENYTLDVYGSDKVGESVTPIIEHNSLSDKCTFHEIKAYDKINLGKYTITALPALHDAGSGPLFYIISDGEKTLLYAHDTNYFTDDVWEYFEREKIRFNLVTLDCTNACRPMDYIGHMGFAENVQVKKRMLELGVADENTVFICNHFSHNGTNADYDSFVPIAAKEGFLTSYDGMKIDF